MIKKHVSKADSETFVKKQKKELGQEKQQEPYKNDKNHTTSTSSINITRNDEGTSI